MQTKQHDVYEVWKEAVEAMGETGRVSREEIEHQKYVLSFAHMRKRGATIKWERFGEGWLEKSLRWAERPFVVAVLAATLYFGCHVEWYAALVLSLFGEYVVRKSKVTLWFVFRSLEVVVYMLARLNAQRGGERTSTALDITSSTCCIQKFPLKKSCSTEICMALVIKSRMNAQLASVKTVTAAKRTVPKTCRACTSAISQLRRDSPAIAGDGWRFI